MESSILALWAHPRARSSAVGRMMCERGDFSVKDEPFMAYYYFSDERISDRRGDVEPQPACRFDVILQGLLREAEQHPVFVKDHAYHVMSRANPAMLRHFRNTFLIRDPAHSLPSLYARMPDFTLQETGYAALFQLFELARQVGGTNPIVIDADELVEQPEAAVSAYCDAVGVSFVAQALQWSDGLHAAMNADWGGWYHHLANSRGFARQENPDYIGVNHNRHLARAYEHCLPFYRALHAHRLRIR
jgi:hypothetical protein